MNLIDKGRLALAACCVLAGIAPNASADSRHLQSLESARSYADTVVALRDAINGGNSKIFQEIDHRNNAVGTDIELVPSRVFIFGNPKVGSRLMQCAPLAAMELPMRMLIREGEQGNTQLYWVKASTLLDRYADSPGEECEQLAERIDDHMAKLARDAARGGD